jgi:histone H3/H4
MAKDNKTKVVKSIISKSAVVKIAKKNGAERIGKEAAAKLASYADKYVAELTAKAVAAAKHANRATIRAEDFDFVVNV